VKILLINPNTSERSLAMMLSVATPHLPPETGLRGVLAARGAPMIVTEADLHAAETEVVRLGKTEAQDAAAVVVPRSAILASRRCARF
jgi:allantoin racemase